MIGVSTGYFFVVVLVLVYGFRPLFVSIMSVSPRTGAIATPENQNIYNIGTFMYFAVAFYVYYAILKSFKAKLAAKASTTTAEANPD